MGFMVLEHKKPVTTWKQDRSHRRKKRRPQGGKTIRKETNFDFAAASKTLTEVTAKVILIAACFYGIFVGYRFATDSPYFAVNKVTWVGNQHLSVEEIDPWAGPVLGENIFRVDLGEISQKLAKHPWVQTASTRRVFPQGLHINITERIPLARIQLDQIYMMDSYGVLLGPEEEKFYGLPLLTGIAVKNPTPGYNVASREATGGLKAMYEFNQLPMFEENPIDTVHIRNHSRMAFLTRNRDMEIHMRTNMVSESFKNLKLVLDEIGGDKGTLSYIDLSFKNKVVVKHQKSIEASQEAGTI
jgi:cell division protein FtsQ